MGSEVARGALQSRGRNVASQAYKHSKKDPTNPKTFVHVLQDYCLKHPVPPPKLTAWYEEIIKVLHQKLCSLLGT